jgi:tetratricopeptide (TPR) repeat protein
MHGLTFLDALVACDAGSAEWHALTAEALVVQLADQVLQSLPVDRQQFRLARRAVARVTHARLNARLRDVLALLEPTGEADATRYDAAAARLLALAHELRSSGRLPLAADVYHLVSDRCRDMPDLCMQAMRARAFTFRLMARFSAADAAYRALLQYATAQGDAHMALKARVGRACVVMARGNTPRARRLLRGVLVDARTTDDRVIQGEVLGNLAWVAGVRRDRAAAIAYARRALRYLTDPTDRDRCRINLSRAYLISGQLRRAARIARQVFRRGVNLDERGLAACVLFELAIARQDEVTAAFLHDWFARNPGCPYVTAMYLKLVVRERRAADDLAGALVAAQNMLAIAATHQLNELLLEADQEERALRATQQPPPAAVEPDASGGLAASADADPPAPALRLGAVPIAARGGQVGARGGDHRGEEGEQQHRIAILHQSLHIG